MIRGIGEGKGLAIKSELDEYYGSKINHGRLYPNLDTLVEKGKLDDRTNNYSLTDRGRREIEARAEWVAEYAD